MIIYKHNHCSLSKYHLVNVRSRKVELLKAGTEKEKQRKNNSYLNPNSHLRHLNISTAKNKQTLPILKNSSRFAELKSCKSREAI